MASPIFIQDDTGYTRHMGNLEQPGGLVKAWRTFGDVPETPMIPRNKFESYCKNDEWGDPFILRLHDQDGIGQCNCDAATGAFEDIRKAQGIELALSPADLYDRINGGSDRGSLLEDAMHELMTEGCGDLATSGQLWKRGQFHAATAVQRSLNVVTEAWICPTFDHCFSAVVAGFRLVSGIPWYSNYTPGSDGWLPGGRGNSGGHAIKGYAPKFRTIQGRVQFGIEHINSWGQWGFQSKGYFVIPEPAYAGRVGGWWAVRQVTDNGGVIPIPQG